VKVHYRGTLIDGTEFDSSYARNEPAVFPLGGVLRCWTEGVQRMKVGGKARLVCPSDVAYGDRGNEAIPGGAALVFEIELLEIVSGPQPSGGRRYPARRGAAVLAAFNSQQRRQVVEHRFSPGVRRVLAPGSRPPLSASHPRHSRAHLADLGTFVRRERRPRSSGCSASTCR
jgi:hypothetical protein